MHLLSIGYTIYPMRIITKAYAKINLFLNVLGKRPDGYHDIESIMQSVSLHDQLLFEKTEEGIFVSSDNGGLPTCEKNLVVKVAEIFRKRYPQKWDGGVSIHIMKSIPISAGLAGGSTDAAAAIVSLSRLFNLNLSYEEMKEIVEDVGCDVAFCLRGGTALVQGKGEIVTQLDPLQKTWIVLATVPGEVSTKEVYDRFDQIGHPNTADIYSFIEDMYQSFNGRVYQKMENVLEGVTATQYPAIREVKSLALKKGATAAVMSGSGPTVFCVCPSLKKAQEVYGALASHVKDVFITSTVDRGLEMEVMK